MKNEVGMGPSITQLEMSDADIEFAERMAGKLGFLQTAYTSTSALWGLYCLPDHSKHRHGCIIKTKELGFLFVADLEDCQLHDLTPSLEKSPRADCKGNQTGEEHCQGRIKSP